MRWQKGNKNGVGNSRGKSEPFVEMKGSVRDCAV